VQGEIGVLNEDIDPPPPRTPSGWDIYDARFAYDPVDDVLYVGINTGNCITGDAGVYHSHSLQLHPAFAS
jgi:hypothetical protein